MSEQPSKKGLIQEFIKFLQTFGVIGLAIAFIIGQASSKLITSIVQNLINPFIGLILPEVDELNDVSVTLGDSTFSYGEVLANTIDFLIIAFIIFLVYKQLVKFKMLEGKST